MIALVGAGFKPDCCSQRGSPANFQRKTTMTKPTKAQEQARERIAQALLLASEAVRLDGVTKLDAAGWADLASRIARLSSAFTLDQILERALERRGESLKLRSGTGELLMLVEVEGGIPPLQMLLLDDPSFDSRVKAAEESLGDL